MDKQCVVDATIPFLYMVHICLENNPQVHIWGRWHSLCSYEFLSVAHSKERERGAVVISEATGKETHHDTYTSFYCSSHP